jgi:hypothetical protein
MQTSRQQMTTRLREALLSRRNPDGGWGYFAGKQTRLEPTCWATLAVGAGAEEPPVLRPGPPAPAPWRHDVPGTPVNYTFQALCALTLAGSPATRGQSLDIARALLDVRGVTFEPSAVIKQDNSLQAWPWVDQTFSWAEPTSVVLILLKKLRKELPAAAGERTAIGERVLADRVCATGGWNYGGSNAFGQNLPAYVPTTAWGLLALQDRADDPVVTRSLARLVDDLRTEMSPQALALAAIALRVHRKDAAAALAALDTQTEAALAHGNVASIAMTLYALTGKVDAFKV